MRLLLLASRFTSARSIPYLLSPTVPSVFFSHVYSTGARNFGRSLPEPHLHRIANGLLFIGLGEIVKIPPCQYVNCQCSLPSLCHFRSLSQESEREGGHGDEGNYSRAIRSVNCVNKLQMSGIHRTHTQALVSTFQALSKHTQAHSSTPKDTQARTPKDTQASLSWAPSMCTGCEL